MNKNEQYKLVGRRDKDFLNLADFYPTPPWVTNILIKYHNFTGNIWECACGDGRLSEVLKKAGYDVISTDLNNYGYAIAGIDFLLEQKSKAVNIVTNPPFKLAYEFMEHCYHLAIKDFALLLPIRYLAGIKRAAFYNMKPPCKIIIIPKKIDFFGNKNPVMEFAWFVWSKNYTGPTEVIWALMT